MSVPTSAPAAESNNLYAGALLLIKTFLQQMEETLVFFRVVEREMNYREKSLEIQTWQINLWSGVEASGTQMPQSEAHGEIFSCSLPILV